MMGGSNGVSLGCVPLHRGSGYVEDGRVGLREVTCHEVGVSACCERVGLRESEVGIWGVASY